MNVVADVVAGWAGVRRCQHTGRCWWCL